MSLPEPPKLVFKYVKVYYDHGLRACYMCDVEFMLDEDKAEADRFPALTGKQKCRRVCWLTVKANFDFRQCRGTS